MDGDFSVPPAVLADYGLDEARVEHLAGGRVNRTMRVRSGRVRSESSVTDESPGDHDLVLQHMVGSAHPDLLGIMENLVRVTSHLEWQRNVNGLGDSWYPLLVPTVNAKPFIMTDGGDVWRAFSYREGQVLRGAQSVHTLAGAAAMYGRFTAETAELGGPPLIETTPGFHDLERVCASLMSDLDHVEPADRNGLASDIDQIVQLKEAVDARCAADGAQWRPDRVVHNDTKLSNVLFNNAGTAPVAVLDLDLAMMGPSWHDVGDIVRSCCWHSAAADSSPAFSVDLFERIIGAFLEAAGATLTVDEIATFAIAGPRLSLELGIRYINDHLRSEPHLAVAGENGHLLRGRSNVNLANEMLSAYDALRTVVDKHLVDHHR